MSEKNETALAAKSTGFLQLADLDFAQVMTDELNGLDVAFDRVKMPSSGSTVFEIPDDDGETTAVKDFAGVILHHQPLFMYYTYEYTGGHNPPDCGSYDGVTGQGNPGGSCRTCRYNQFGTGKNDGKACKNYRRLYILREGEIFPLLLHLPPTSLQEYTRYMKQLLKKRLTQKDLRSNTVVTRFSLQKAANTDSVPYSQAKFAFVRELTPEEQAVINRLSYQIKANCQQTSLDDDLLADAGQDNPFIDPETGEIIEA